MPVRCCGFQSSSRGSSRASPCACLVPPPSAAAFAPCHHSCCCCLWCCRCSWRCYGPAQPHTLLQCQSMQQQHQGRNHPHRTPQSPTSSTAIITLLHDRRVCSRVRGRQLGMSPHWPGHLSLFPPPLTLIAMHVAVASAIRLATKMKQVLNPYGRSCTTNKNRHESFLLPTQALLQQLRPTSRCNAYLVVWGMQGMLLRCFASQTHSRRLHSTQFGMGHPPCATVTPFCV